MVGMFKKIIDSLFYLNVKELKYSNKIEKNLTNEQIKEFIKYKENNSVQINLKSFNSMFIYYIDHETLKIRLKEFISFNTKYYDDNEVSLIEKNFPDIMVSRILSEIEGTLLIENIPTTRKKIEDVIKNKEIKSETDIVIRNMDIAIKYIFKKPTFNKENLFELYNLLSKDSLTDELKLKDNEFYRYDSVYIDGYEGCPFEEIEECMNSLFIFINKNINNKTNLKYLLPHIAHYYILYIHPYFDYNGRCARLVSLWISNLLNIYDHPLYISEAINDNKKEYYQSIVNTRDMDNDITYFLNYIFDTANKYCLLYENIEFIDDELTNNLISLTILEKTYLKKILSKIKTKYFNQKIFIELVNLDITKQGALKILNKFEKYNILKSIYNSRNQKMFYINNDYLKYKIN